MADPTAEQILAMLVCRYGVLVAAKTKDMAEICHVFQQIARVAALHPELAKLVNPARLLSRMAALGFTKAEQTFVAQGITMGVEMAEAGVVTEATTLGTAVVVTTGEGAAAGAGFAALVPQIAVAIAICALIGLVLMGIDALAKHNQAKAREAERQNFSYEIQKVKNPTFGLPRFYGKAG